MIVCVPALVFSSFSFFTSKEKPRYKSADLHLISLSISAVVMVLQVLIMLGKNTFACNLSALIMSILHPGLVCSGLVCIAASGGHPCFIIAGAIMVVAGLVY